MSRLRRERTGSILILWFLLDLCLTLGWPFCPEPYDRCTCGEVPSKTFKVVKFSVVNGSIFMDCHLMVEKPEDYIIPLKEAGANMFTFHVEATSRFLCLLNH